MQPGLRLDELDVHHAAVLGPQCRRDAQCSMNGVSSANRGSSTPPNVVAAALCPVNRSAPPATAPTAAAPATVATATPRKARLSTIFHVEAFSLG